MKRLFVFPLEVFILIPLSMLYHFGVAFKNLIYDLQWKTSKRFAKPVFSVGNISVGGTGKTPVVMYLLKALAQYDVAVLSRGYGSEVAKKKQYPARVNSSTQPQVFGDEPTLIYDKFPQSLVVLDSNRYRGGRWAMQHNSSLQAFVLDDGFQHRSLYRDLDIVVLDVDQYWKSGFLLPHGRLREPLSSVRRAHVILLTKWQNVSGAVVQRLEQRLSKISQAAIFKVQTRLKLWHWEPQKAQPVALPMSHDFSAQKVWLFSGIGNPGLFEQDILRQFSGLHVAGRTDFPDHYLYKKQDLENLAHLARTAGANLLCTEKDFVKIKTLGLDLEIWVAEQDLQIPNEFLQIIMAKMR